jgi:hypothetical protein
MMRVSIFIVLLTLCFAAQAQDNYEIQVYGAQTTDKGATMVELHSNYTFGGEEYTNDGVLPTHHIIHETIEITHGFTSWFEVGFYFFNAIGDNHRTTYVGSHIRPRVMVPESWKWPVGVSLSMEFGFQKKEYCVDDATLEIRPIVDKTIGRVYLAFNPVFDKSFHGLNKDNSYGFSPNFKGSCKITKVVAAGIEYYGAVGSVKQFDPVKQQSHQLFFVTDLSFATNWEFNAGYGIGLTGATENSIFKVILGYKLHKKGK